MCTQTHNYVKNTCKILHQLYLMHKSMHQDTLHSLPCMEAVHILSLSLHLNPLHPKVNSKLVC